MYDNEAELNNPISRIFHITIINPLPPKIDISQKILEKTSYEFKERLKFNTITSIKDLYKPKYDYSEQNPKKGILDIRWLDDIFNKPCLILLYYHINNNATNLDSEQQNIFNIIQDIKKIYNNIFIYLFIIYKEQHPESPYQFGNDDRNKKFNLRSLIGKDFIFVFPDEEIWKYFEFQNFCSNVVFYSQQYYTRMKMRIKEKKAKGGRIEEKIENCIKLGILSIIKSKKKEPEISKHFEEAYNLILSKNFDIKNYFYGNKSPPNHKLNFSEIRSIADFIFFKTLKLTKKTKINKGEKMRSKSFSLMTKIMGSETEHKIDRFFLHIKRFINNNFYDIKNEDCFAFIEYYWLFQRYNKLGLFIKENLKELSTSQDKVLLLGIVNLERIYNLIKMIRYYRKYLINQDISIINHKGKEINITMVKTKKSFYYGKAPMLVIRDANNPLSKEDLPFNENIYIKKFIYDKKLSLDNMMNDLNNKYIPEALDFYQKFNPKDLRNEKNIKYNKACGINLYLHILLNLSCLENDKEDNNFYEMPNININMEQINTIIHNFHYMKKFPILYIKFLDKYNQCLIYQKNSGKKFDNIQKTQLYTNLFILGNLRHLDEKEEEIFFDLLNDEQFLPSNKKEDEKIYINIDYNTQTKKDNNNSFLFDYSVEEIEKSQERKILDLVEYKLIFKTNFKSEANILKFNSFKIIFKSESNQISNQNPDDKNNKSKISKNKIELIEHELSKEELDNYILGKNSKIEIIRKLFMKNSMNKIQIYKIIFSFAKKENIFYQMNIKNDLSKLIFLDKSNKNILSIKYPSNNNIAGINQLFKFDFEVNKDISNDISIKDFKINLDSIPSFYTKEIKESPSNMVFGIPLNNSVNNLTNTRNMSLNMNNYMGLSQQLLNQQLVNNMNMQFLLQNNLNNNINNANLNNKNNRPQQNTKNQSNPIVNTQNFNLNNYPSMLFPNPLQINPNMTMPNLQNIQQLPTPNKSMNSLTPFMVTKTEQVELPPPEFYFFDENEKKIIKKEKNMEKNLENLEEMIENNKNKFSILIKFIQKGFYNIKFLVTYSLKRKDISDIYEISQENILKFEVIEPFNCTYEINSANFFSVSKENAQKENIKINKYLIDEKICFNFILKNKLQENIEIKNIEIELDNDKLNGKNKNLEINSNLLEVINMPELAADIKKDILTVLSRGEYCIPFETKFLEEFKGKIGKIKIKWITPLLKEYEQNLENQDNNIILLNENCFDFPYIIINKLELDYKYEIEMNEKKEILLNIKVENHTKKNKKIIFFIENGNEINCMISGKIRQSKNIRAEEAINFMYKLIPLQFGELKLPSLKIWEISSISGKDKKICSHYYFPQKIKVI